jgi:nucleolar protein 9
MALKTWPVFQALKTGKPITEDDEVAVPEEALDPEAEEAAAAQARLDGWKNRRNPKSKEGDLVPNMQGCLLLQAMVGLPEGNVGVLER